MIENEYNYSLNDDESINNDEYDSSLDDINDSYNESIDDTDNIEDIPPSDLDTNNHHHHHHRHCRPHNHYSPVNPTHPNYPSDHSYYDTVVHFGEKHHHSHECRFKNCEAPSIIEGYCPFHYQLVCAHESRYYLKNMTYFLQDMHRILRRFEKAHFPVPRPPHESKCHACKDFHTGLCRGNIKCPR